MQTCREIDQNADAYGNSPVGFNVKQKYRIKIGISFKYAVDVTENISKSSIGYRYINAVVIKTNTN